MAQTIKAALTAFLEVAQTSSGDLSSGNQKIQFGSTSAINIPDGTADGSANRVYADRDIVGSTIDYDLFDFAGASDGDGVYALTVVKGIFVKNNDATADVTISNGTTNGWTGFGATYSIKIAPGGVFCWWDPDGVAVADASSHTLKIAPASGTGGFDLVVIGEQ